MSHQHRPLTYLDVAEIGPWFWSKVEVRGPDDCWEWTGYRMKFGYGRFPLGHRPSRRNVLAHRAVWVLTYGGIPDGLDVCHDCDNPPCCNTRHLFLGTHRDNMIDRENKGRTRGIIPGLGGQLNAAKTHCKWGHPLSGANVHVSAAGSRRCVTCERDYSRRAYLRRKARMAS